MYMSVGLDIGSKSIKIVELSPEGGGFKLLGSGVLGYSGATPDNFLEESDILPLSDAIRKLHKEARISSKDITISLPEPQVFTRLIKLPSLSDQEIASAVKWEAEQYIPIPLAEAVVQHQILERRESGPVPEVLVLLVAAPRVLVEKYVKVVEGAGLNVVAVETEMIPLARSLAPEGRVVLLVDFGARSTDIAVAKNAQVAFSRSIPTAGEAFSRAVSQVLSIPYQQAEEYKRVYGLSPSQLEGKIRVAIEPVFRVVADEIKKAIHFYQSDEKGEAPSSVILSGGTAGMPEAISSLTKILGVEVLMGNPFSKVTADAESLKSLIPYAPLYAIAVGLAQKGL